VAKGFADISADDLKKWLDNLAARGETYSIFVGRMFVQVRVRWRDETFSCRMATVIPAGDDNVGLTREQIYIARRACERAVDSWIRAEHAARRRQEAGMAV
jgi:hypothetical protein